MPAFIPAVDSAKLILHMRWLNQEVKNVTYWKSVSPGGFTSTTRASLAQAMVDWWNTYFKLQVAPQVGLYAVEVINQENQNAPSHLLSVAPASQGTSATGGIALNSTVAVSFRTALRGRNFRGRWYVAGVPDVARFDSGSVSTAYSGSLLSAFTQLLNASLFPMGTLVIASKYFNKVARSTALLTPVTAIIVENLLDSMRRRLIGRGA